jgi:hypothetical protein
VLCDDDDNDVTEVEDVPRRCDGLRNCIEEMHKLYEGGTKE